MGGTISHVALTRI